MKDRLAYKVSEAADALGISRAKAYELIAEDKLPSIRVGSSIRVPVDALRAWVEEQNEERRRVS